jgi:hypothetical protein
MSNTTAIKTIIVQAGQSLADIALQEYGTYEGVILVIQANPGLSVSDQLAGGQELNLFTGYTVNLVKELVKVEPYASALQSLLAQWAALIKFPATGITVESDPVFTAWLATFEPFSGVYNDLTGKPALFSGSYTDLTNKPTLTTDFLSLTDVLPTSYVGKAKNIPIVTDSENGLDFMETVQAKLTHLADFPASYLGQALKFVRVKADESGIEFYTPAFISGITKAMVEAVLTGVIGSHTHDYLPTSVKQEIEINDTWKLGSNLYVENVFIGADLTQVNYWSSAAKVLKLFTKDITYTGGNPTTIVLKDEVTGKLLTTTIAYTGSEVLNVTKVVS